MEISLFNDMKLSSRTLKKKKVVPIKNKSVVERPLPPKPLEIVVEEFKEEDVVEEQPPPKQMHYIRPKSMAFWARSGGFNLLI